MSRIIGIDLGTTNSLVAYVDDTTGLPRVIPDRDGKVLLPSIVSFTPEGTLVPRGHDGAVVTDPEAVVERSVGLARDGVVDSHSGTRVEVRARSLCLHGDTPGAVALARLVRNRLRESGIRVEAFA